MTARFIVTTGRCGSKLLSQLLREHPAVLSLSAFFGTLQSPSVPAFPGHPVTGAEFWELLSMPRPEFASVVRRCWTPGEPQPGRELLGEPPLLKVALPHLTAEPEALHEELGGYVRTLPRADAGTQYSRVFAWLGGRLGRPQWIERSGGSTWFLPSLLACWPAGRYVHLVRDGRDVAVSMSRQCGFRLAVLADDLSREAAGDAPGASVPGASPQHGIERMAARAAAMRPGEPVPVERFGEIWARQVVAAEERLSLLDDCQVMRLHYERLVASPVRELRRLMDFFGLADETPQEWIHSSARQVVRREPAWPQLPEPDRGRLDAACDPGLRLLGYR